MKNYICIKDFYIEDAKFASKGDRIKLLQDYDTIVNIDRKQKVIYNGGIYLSNSIYFKEVDEKPADDKVNHPKHYTWLKEKCGIEVIDITRHLDFCTGNAVKYLLRAGYKEEEGYSQEDKTIEDLKKAVFYINDRIKYLKNDKERISKIQQS